MTITSFVSCAGAAALVAATAIACSGGGSSSTTPTTPPAGGGCTAPATSTTITISNNSVCPQNITISIGTQVTFINNDTIDHAMYSDPHPEHTDCPDLNQVGYLTPTQRRTSGNLNVTRVCGFHDHLHPDNNALRGKITIQ